ncbi:hypothetical protein ACWD0Z_06490 [Streptomyces sp. NPDC003007]
MSAPLVVNTRDGVCWTRRTVTSGGIALYAPESVPTCPDFVMATLPELAEHGIVGSADVLPVPAGPEPVAGPALPWAHVMADDDLHGFLGDLVSAAMGRWQHSPEVPDRDVLAAVEKACAAWRTPGQGYRSDEPAGRERTADEDPIRYTLTEQAPVTIYRAEHPDSGITLGHYGTEAAARKHCETLAGRDPLLAAATFSWIEDDEDRVAELVAQLVRDAEVTTGYIVTALEAPSEYDEEANE